jgi:ABC-type multidrug transport system ATPase subunit
MMHKLFDDASGILSAKYFLYPVSALSGGNKKKLAVLLANLASPSLLMLDECTSGVDPIAAQRIVAHLKAELLAESVLYTDNERSLSQQQGLLFSSHRIDECGALCDRVVILNEGSVCFDGSIRAFENLATLFFQVDVVLYRAAVSGMNAAKERIIAGCGGAQFVERVVVYNDCIIRFTFEKKRVRLSNLWRELVTMSTEGIVVRYNWREMDMEEALSNIMASSALEISGENK